MDYGLVCGIEYCLILSVHFYVVVVYVEWCSLSAWRRASFAWCSSVTITRSSAAASYTSWETVGGHGASQWNLSGDYHVFSTLITGYFLPLLNLKAGIPLQSFIILKKIRFTQLSDWNAFPENLPHYWDHSAVPL